jgi:hypothetical protein
VAMAALTFRNSRRKPPMERLSGTFMIRAN